MPTIPEQQAHQGRHTLVASALVPACQEESCVDETPGKTTRCIHLLPQCNELHVAPTAKVSAQDQEHAESGV
jgi:hypothetical protein